MGQGLAEPARAVIDYLLHSGYSAAHRVEETPAGLIFTPADGPDRIWASYLAAALSRKPAAATSLPVVVSDAADEGIDLRHSDPAALLNPKANADRVRNLPPPRQPVPGRRPAEPFPQGLQRILPPPPPQPAQPMPPGRLCATTLGARWSRLEGSVVVIVSTKVLQIAWR